MTLLAMATATHIMVIDHSRSAPTRNNAFQLACKRAAKRMSRTMGKGMRHVKHHKGVFNSEVLSSCHE
jgi:hypothetical protein